MFSQASVSSWGGGRVSLVPGSFQVGGSRVSLVQGPVRGLGYPGRTTHPPKGLPPRRTTPLKKD